MLRQLRNVELLLSAPLFKAGHFCLACKVSSRQFFCARRHVENLVSHDTLSENMQFVGTCVFFDKTSPHGREMRGGEGRNG